MKKVYYASQNNGDGSTSVMFFESQECIDILEEHDLEGYGGCEGGGCFTVVGEILNIKVRTLEEVKELIA